MQYIKINTSYFTFKIETFFSPKKIRPAKTTTKKNQNGFLKRARQEALKIVDIASRLQVQKRNPSKKPRGIWWYTLLKKKVS